MYSNTRFSALMKGFPRKSFDEAVCRYKNDTHHKGFRSWDQLLAMIFAQLSGCRSLREVEAGFNSQSVHHYHLGTRDIKRSTLSDANTKRNSDVFAQMCHVLMQQVNRKKRSELKDLLYLLDSTAIPLKGLGYDDWSAANKSNRTQGLKVHMLIEAQQTHPIRVDITAANVNDIDVGRQMPLETGATYVFDKAYTDYNWWHKLGEAGSYFVSRFKHNAGLNTVSHTAIPVEDEGIILEDAVVMFKNKRPGGQRINNHYDTPLRKVIVSRPDKTTPLVLVTNDFVRPAIEIANLYKQRWSIELFFKWLKQNLKIKRFLGKSQNAVKIQIYTALMTYLLVSLYRQANRINMSLKLFMVELRNSLFQRMDTALFIHRKQRTLAREYQKIQGVLCL